MYNAEQKLDFITEYTNSEIVADKIIRIFENVGKLEELYGNDMCYISDRDKLLNIVDCVSGLKISSTNERIKFLKRYVKWCAKRFNGVSDEIDNINSEDINKIYIKNHMVSDPEDMNQYLNSFLRPDDEFTIDIVYKCVLWLAFAGIQEKYVVEIKSKDIDLNIMKNSQEFYVSFDSEKYPIPVVAYKTFKYCVELKSFNYSHPKYGKDISRDRIVGDELLRGIRSAAKSYQVLTQNIAKRALEKEIKRKVSYRGASWSGLFYRINKRELNGENIDFKIEALKFIGDKEYKLDNTKQTQNGMKLRIARELESDYKLWKLAFKK